MNPNTVVNPLSPSIRNIAIIAHVDHGKTTLVDAMLRQSGIFREGEQVLERVMDSNELERERGITILAKNTAITYHGTRINIVDTPGHSDFGGEVERSLKLVDGVLLLVDASEGPLPQTRYVLRKALEAKLPPIVVINKIDRSDARPQEVLNEVYDLFIDLDATEDHSISPSFTVSPSSASPARRWMALRRTSSHCSKPFCVPFPLRPGTRLRRCNCLLPIWITANTTGVWRWAGFFRARCGGVTKWASLNWTEACRRPTSPSYMVLKGWSESSSKPLRRATLWPLPGVEGITIGETVTSAECPAPLPHIPIDEPTISMVFTVNTSPFSGRDGAFVTSRHLRERLDKELLTNVSIRVEEMDSPDSFKVMGRGELQLAILIEMMRREGYELAVGKPEIITRTVDGRLQEPSEQLIVDVPEEFVGVLMQEIGMRRGVNHKIVSHGAGQAQNGRVRLEFSIPSRGLIGLRSEILKATRGTVVMNTLFDGYIDWQGDMATRLTGSLVADRSGRTTAYALWNLQERGDLFVQPGVEVYEGMVIGQNSRWDDIDVNVVKEKKQTNMRASVADEAIRLVPFRPLTLEEAIEFIAEDELVEVTPKSIRLRKKILEYNKRPKKYKHPAST